MRYAKYAIVAVIFASLISVAPNFAYSQAGQLTVNVDKTTYGAGETIKTKGMVPAVLEGVPVAIQVFNPRNTMYTIGQTTPSSDGMYSFDFKIGGKLGIDGIYTVKSTYSGQSVQTTFEFVVASSTTTPTIKSTTVKFENNVFNVETSLSNGSVKSIEVDEEFASLIITISTSGKEDGTFDITLPRNLIDSKINNDDDEFIVLVDGDDSAFSEKGTTSTERTLSIPISSGTTEIEIIGTQVIPEFGVLAAIVLATSIGAIIVASRRNTMLKVLPV